MKRKGFTLVELLAVIVILSVISIITIPIIGNVIEESKKKALEQSVHGLVESANYYSINNEGTYEFLFDSEHKGSTIKGESLDYNGSIDAEGKLYLDNEGNVSICVYNDNYYAYKNYNSGIVVGNRKEDNCNIGYDVISNKYVAFLESEGMSSNVYSKEEVNNIIDGVENKITINTNEITNVKGTIETLQSSLNNYALKSSLDTTNSNLDTLSSIVSNNQNSINQLSNKINSIVIKKVDFTIGADGVVSILYPDGFNLDNTYLYSLKTYFTSGEAYFYHSNEFYGMNPLYVQFTYSSINLYFSNKDFYGKSGKLILMHD